MLRTTISRIKKVCSIAFVPRILRGDQRCVPGKFETFSYAVQRKASKSTKTTHDGEDGNKHDVASDYLFTPKESKIEESKRKDEAVNLIGKTSKDKTTPFVSTPPNETQAEKCQRIIDQAFGKDDVKEPVISEQYFSSNADIDKTRREINDAEIAKLKLAQGDNTLFDDRTPVSVFKMAPELVADENTGELIDLMIKKPVVREEPKTGGIDISETNEDLGIFQRTMKLNMACGREPDLTKKTDVKGIVDDIPLKESFGTEEVDKYINNPKNIDRSLDLKPFMVEDDAEALEMIKDDRSDHRVLACSPDDISYIRKENLNQTDSDVESNKILNATTEKEEEEKLTQKLEIIEETPLVEAQKPNIEGFTEPPRVLGQIIEPAVSCCSGNKMDRNLTAGGPNSFDEVAQRCLDSPVGKIDEVLLNEMEKLGIPVTCLSEIKTPLSTAEDNRVQMDFPRRQPINSIDYPKYALEGFELKPEGFSLYSSTRQINEKNLPEMEKEPEEKPNPPPAEDTDEILGLHPNTIRVDPRFDKNPLNFNLGSCDSVKTKATAPSLEQKTESDNETDASELDISHMKGFTNCLIREKTLNEAIANEVTQTVLPVVGPMATIVEGKTSNDKHKSTGKHIDNMSGLEKKNASNPQKLTVSIKTGLRNLIKGMGHKQQPQHEEKDYFGGVQKPSGDQHTQSNTSGMDTPNPYNSYPSQNYQQQPNNFGQNIHWAEPDKHILRAKMNAYVWATHHAAGGMQNTGAQHPKDRMGYTNAPYNRAPYNNYQVPNVSWGGQFAPQQFAPQQFAPQQFAPQQFAPQPFAPQPFAPQHARKARPITPDTKQATATGANYNYIQETGPRGPEMYFDPTQGHTGYGNIPYGGVPYKSYPMPGGAGGMWQGYNAAQPNAQKAAPLTPDSKHTAGSSNNYMQQNPASSDGKYYGNTGFGSGPNNNFRVKWEQNVAAKPTPPKDAPSKPNKTNMCVVDDIPEREYEPKPVCLPEDFLNQQLHPHYVLTCNETCPISPNALISDTSRIVDATEAIFKDLEDHFIEIDKTTRDNELDLKPYITDAPLGSIPQVLNTLPRLSDNVSMTELLRRVRERSRIIECRNELKALGVQVEPAVGKCGRKAPRCSPLAPRSPPNDPVPLPTFGLPKLKPKPRPCKKRKPDTKKCSTIDMDLSTGLQLGPQINDTAGIYPEMACEMNESGAGLCAARSKADLTEEVIDRLQSLGKILTGALSQGKAYLADSFVRYRQTPTGQARGYEPWAPIPSWPIEKKKICESDRKQKQCSPGCPVPPTRGDMCPDPPCKLKPCEGFPKRTFSKADYFAVSLGTNKVYDLGEF